MESRTSNGSVENDPKQPSLLAHAPSMPSPSNKSPRSGTHSSRDADAEVSDENRDIGASLEGTASSFIIKDVTEYSNASTLDETSSLLDTITASNQAIAVASEVSSPIVVHNTDNCNSVINNKNNNHEQLHQQPKPQIHHRKDGGCGDLNSPRIKCTDNIKGRILSVDSNRNKISRHSALRKKNSIELIANTDAAKQAEKLKIAASLSQENAGVFPLDLIQKWCNGPRSLEHQEELMKPYYVRGVAVSSDSTGSSKLSGTTPLLEIIWLIHQPKELVFARGRAVGGHAIGTWAADNTFMFYPTDKCTPSDVIAAVLQAQEENTIRNKVQIGFGLHLGEYACFGDMIFGNDAELIEEFAEEFTKSGDVLITDSLLSAIEGDPRFTLEDRPVPEMEMISHAIKSTSAFKHLQTNIEDFRGMEMYPAAFSDDFFSFMRDCRPLEHVTTARAAEVSNFLRNVTVVLLKVKYNHEKFPLILDCIIKYLLVKNDILNISKEYSAELIKCDGILGIFVFDGEDSSSSSTAGANNAFNFSRKTFLQLSKLGLSVSFGIASGPCYIFKLANGKTDISGNPVNIASKFAEDSGLIGIFSHDSASILTKGNPIKIKLSGIELKGYSLTIDPEE